MTCKQEGLRLPEKPIGIIPVRGGSKRFPRKNIAPLAGKPLLAYAVEAAQESAVFDAVCVSSEDEEILRVAEDHGARVVLKRPKELAGDLAQVKDVCRYLLEWFRDEGYQYREFGVLLATNPLRTAQDVCNAYKIFRRQKADFCLSLVAYAHPPQRAVRVASGFVEPFLGNQYMKQTQLLDPLYRHDGSIIFAKSEAFLKENGFYGKRTVPYFIPQERSVDIDSPLDLAWAEFLIGHFAAHEPAKPKEGVQGR